MKRCRRLFLVTALFALSLPLWAAQGEDGRNPNDPLDQGGETCATATPILTVPYCDTGTTDLRINDYPVPCNTGSAAPDVVYTMTPPVTSVLSFSLCGSDYNTALTIWRGCPSAGGVLICCSDNTCGDDACCAGVTLLANVQYFIVVDGGVGGAVSGGYRFNVVQGENCPTTLCIPQCIYANGDIENNNFCGNGSGATITCGDTVCGQYTSATGIDYITLIVPGTECRLVTIDVFGDDTPGFFPFGQGFDPNLALLSVPACTTIASDLNSGVGNDARLQIQLNPGTYRIEVLGTTTTGPWIVATACAPCTTACPFPNMDFEPNDVCAGGGAVIACGDTTCGEITPVGDNDYYYFRVLGQTCQLVTIDVFGDDTPGWYPFGQGLNPLVALFYGLCDSVVTFDDTSGVGDDARIQVCLEPGTYRLLVRAQQNPLTAGPYILATYCEPCECPIDTCVYPTEDIEPNNLCSGGGGIVTCGDTLCGEITGDGNFHDYYYLDIFGPGCQNVTIDVFGNDTPGYYPFGRGLDPHVRIYVPACDSTVVFDSNSGVGNDARIDSICLPPGIYRLYISTQVAGGTPGPYVVAVNCTPCDCPDDCPYPNRDFEPVNNECATFNPQVTCGDTLCGDLLAGVDNVDYYLLTLPGPDPVKVTIDVFGTDTPGYYPFGLGLNPWLRLISTGCTNVIAVDTAGGVGDDARIVMCVLPGIYNIAVHQDDFTSGPYILAVACAPCDSCPWPNRDAEPINNQCGTQNPLVECGGSYCGEIEGNAAPDQDWYLLQIFNCTQLYIDVLGDDTGGQYPYDLGLNPAVELWSADCQTMLAQDFNSGAGEDPRLVSDCLRPGIYMIRVYGEGTQGPYILAVACAQCECPPPCDVICPPGALLENEPCPVLVDTTNGGCDTEPSRFQPLDCGQVYCATASRTESYNDSDWYRLGLAEPTHVRICVTSEFDGILMLVHRSPTSNLCGEGLDIVECLEITGCEGLQCISICLPRGGYMISFSPHPFEETFLCRDYVLAVACSPCEPPVCEAPDSVVIHFPDSLYDVITEGDIKLFWPPVPGADEYRIYRTSDPHTPFVPSPATFVGLTADTFYVHDNAVTLGGYEEYIYYVVSYCRYDYPPCGFPPAVIVPVTPDIITPRE